MKRVLQEKFLLYRIRAKKDPVAFGKVYDLYAPRIYRFVYFKVSSKEEAQDITAEVFLKAWQYLLDPKGQEVRHLSALLYRIARNNVIDFYRQRAARGETTNIEPHDESIADGREQFKKLDAKIDVEALAPALRSLKDEYREILVMKYIDQLETNEIAEALDKTPGNVRVLLHRAMSSLKTLTQPDYERVDLTTGESKKHSRGRKS